MKMKNVVVGILSACLLSTSFTGVLHVQAKETLMTNEEVVEEIPQVYLEALGRDVEWKDFIRPITAKDKKRFDKKIKKYYSKMDSSASKLTKSTDLAYLDSTCSAKGHGSIGIASALLNGEEVTLLTLGGTNIKEGQASGVKEDILSALELSNQYLRNVVKMFDAVDENMEPLIPQDRPVIVSGISLGGMVAQQLLAQKDIMKRFDIQQIICFGSPLLEPFKRNDDTRVVRFCDSMDIVPYLGRSVLHDTIRQEVLNKDPLKYVQKLDEKEVILKDGGYKSFISAHMLSYIEGKCWKKYDALGVYGGHNKIVMLEDLQFFENPSR